MQVSPATILEKETIGCIWTKHKKHNLKAKLFLVCRDGLEDVVEQSQKDERLIRRDVTKLLHYGYSR